MNYFQNVQSSTNPLISVVVCTYNRSDLLTIVLESLVQQTLDIHEFEIIVVDNNSTDDTQIVVESFQQRQANVRYICELQQGLSHARNRGWQEALGEYVAYTDDDCKVPEQWLKEAKDVIKRHSPDVFGGPYYAFYNSPKPRWWKDNYKSREHAETARPLTQGEYLSGGNIFFRRQLLKNMNGFDADFGMSGQQIAMGEETDLQKRIRLALVDSLIYYDPKLFVYHLVRAEKMSIAWTAKYRFISGRDSYRTYRYNTPRTGRRYQLKLLRRTMQTLKLFVSEIAIGLFRRDHQQYPYLQNYLYDYAFGNLTTLGRIYEQYQQSKRSKEIDLQKETPV